jgi:tRNA (cmo5U34)-methyltransferase
MTETSYRWNSSAAAEAYDQAAPAIHPCYEMVQDQILGRLPFAADEPFIVFDLGGGSGRLAERMLAQFAGACVTVVDQSDPFLALAERRLRPLGARADFIRRRLQDDWAVDLRQPPNAIVSTSAIHHLEPGEKRALFARCFSALMPGGLFINGDEYRPPNDADYRALLEKWSRHMFSALAAGSIPASFCQTIEQWHERNIGEFGQPKTSGDDCHETIATQVRYLREAGFDPVEVVWSRDLWAVVAAQKRTHMS